MQSHFSEYAKAIEDLEERLNKAISPNEPISDEAAWRSIVTVVERIEQCAKAAKLPRAAALFTVDREQTPEELRSEMRSKDKVQVLVMRDTLLVETGATPAIVVHPKKEGGHTVRKYLPVMFPEGQPYRYGLLDWEEFLKRPPTDSTGIYDIPAGILTWKEHLDREERRDIIHLGDRLDLGWPPSSKTAEYRNAAKAIRDRYAVAKVTPSFIRTMVEFSQQMATSAEQNKARFGISDRVKRGTADGVHIIMVEAAPLDLAGWPDMPGLDEMAPKEAYALLEQLRKCCLTGEAKETTSIETAPDTNAKSHPPDGPQVLGTIFCWKGEKAHIQEKPFALLKMVWNAQAHTVALDDVISEIWDDSEGPTSLQNARARINDAFRDVGCPLSLSLAGKVARLK